MSWIKKDADTFEKEGKKKEVSLTGLKDVLKDYDDILKIDPWHIVKIHKLPKYANPVEVLQKNRDNLAALIDTLEAL